MEKKKCIIIDDEPAAHYVLINHIKQVSDLELVTQCYNGIEAMNYLRKNEVDLMFLDINMPEISGLELLKSLKNPPRTILTTAYSEFALESYEYGVIDYLLKPISFPRFLTSIERFFSLYPAAQEAAEEEVNSIRLKVDGEMLEINLDELLYAQSLGNYVKLTTGERSYLASVTTNELEAALPAGKFMRIHKSYIIAIGRIEYYEKGFVQIAGHQMPVGITFRQKLSERMK